MRFFILLVFFLSISFPLFSQCDCDPLPADPGTSVVVNDVQSLNQAQGIELPEVAFDIDCQPRPMGGTTDIGADEWLEATTSISEVGFYENIRVYPNPFNTRISVEPPFDGIIEILNISGKVLYQKTIESKDEVMIELNHLQVGIYILMISSDSKMLRKKIIKH